MLNSFVQIPPILRENLTDHCLVTPNDRLAKEYRRGFSIEMLQAGKSAWRAPLIQSLSQFLASCYADFLEANPTEPKTLTPAEMIELAHLASPVSLSPAVVANLLNNWNTLHQYSIPLRALPAAADRTLFFENWAIQFEKLISASKKIPAVLVGERLASANWLPPYPIITVGLEELTQPQQKYCAFLCSRGSVSFVGGSEESPMCVAEHLSDITANRVTVDAVALSNTLTGHCLYQAASQQDEIIAAAQWAKDAKLNDPQATIGIVVPTLESNHDQISYEVGSVLDPLEGSKSTSFDISGGNQLNLQPVWQHGRALLNAVLTTTDFQTIDRLWRSPFFSLSKDLGELHPWPLKLNRTFQLGDLLNLIKNTPSKTFGEYVSAYRDPQEIRTYTDHLVCFQKILMAAGWPSQTALASYQYQAFQGIENLINDTLARPLANGAERMNGQHALIVFDHALSGSLFAPQRPPADIQVLGSLETTGLQFSHLWVCGLDANRFPGTATRRTYIPGQLAQEFDIPRSSQAEENSFCRRQLNGWINQSKEIRFSYCGQENNTEVPASLLFGHCQKPNLVPAATNWTQQSISLETYNDDFGPPIDSPPKRTGVRLLQQQADCAFRSFAVTRLGLDEQRLPHRLLDHLDRGNLVHNVLQALFQDVADQQDVIDMAYSTISRAVDYALDKLPGTLPKAFHTTEHERVSSLVSSWLEFEKSRPSFRVRSVESVHAVEIAGLTLNIRIDRQDDMSGEHVVIDYKTGDAKVSGMWDLPLTNLQLPLYAQIDPDIHGVHFGIVQNPPKLRGINTDGVQGKGVTLAEWQNLQQSWRSELDRLAGEFQQGNAVVAPSSALACRYCHLKSVCRIQQQSESVET